MIELLEGLKRWEGHISWMYLDSLGFVTCGIGNLLKNPEAACALPWINELDGALAEQSVVETSYHVIEAAPKGRGAGEYKPLTYIRLSDVDIDSLAVSRLSNEFLPGLRRLFVGFDDYPKSARGALVDMAWNLGVAGLGHFLRLRKACDDGNWIVAANECRRSTSRQERNDWTAQQFREASREAATPVG